MVLDSNADVTGFRRLKSATNGNSTIELTASSGRVLMSPDPDEFPAITTRNTSNTVTFRVDLDSGNVTSQGQISGSGDLQVGGHITGSGDLKLFDGDIHLNSTVFFDSSESTGDCLIRQNPDNSLTVDANNNLWLVADENIYITKNFVQKVKFDVHNELATFSIPISSSTFITASALHTNGGITAPGGGGGDLTFLDTNGNVTAGGITMISDGSLTLNFNDNQISGSGHVSASAFFGDGSNLQGISARTVSVIHNSLCQIKNSRNACYI